jgi:hypothetical protein
MTREPVLPTPRRAMTPKRRAEAFLSCEGRCGWCHAKITGPYEVDHRITLFMGGADELHNLECLHPDCHKAKTTGQDRPAHDKIRRIEQRANGTRRPRKPIPSHTNPWPDGPARKLGSGKLNGRKFQERGEKR